MIVLLFFELTKQSSLRTMASLFDGIGEA